MKNIKHSIMSLIVIVSLTSCKEKQTLEVATKSIEKNLVQVDKSHFENGKFKTSLPTLQAFNESIKLNGYVNVPPKNKASVTTLIEGYIKNINLLVGDKVKKGQYLFTVESTNLIDIQQNYLEVKEKLRFLKNDFERQKTLFDEKISSQKKYLLAESSYRSSLATYTGLKNKLLLYGVNLTDVSQGKFTSNIRVKTPISGVISKINTIKGDFISPSQTVIEIINTDYMHLELQAFERDIPNIKKGLQITYKIPESSQESYAAVVNLIGASINQQTKTTTVYGSITDKQKEGLVSGMYIEAQIFTKTSEKLAILNEAIITEAASTYVLILKNKNDTSYEFEAVDVTVEQVGEVYTTLRKIDSLKDQQILTKGAFMFNTD